MFTSTSSPPCGSAYWVVNAAPTELRARWDRGSRAALPGESYSSVTRRVTRTHLPARASGRRSAQQNYWCNVWSQTAREITTTSGVR